MLFKAIAYSQGLHVQVQRSIQVSQILVHTCDVNNSGGVFFALSFIKFEFDIKRLIE
jgi:hypothetical protein